MGSIRKKIKKKTKNKSLVNGTLFSIYSFINRSFSFILLMVLANYITPSEYGYLSLWGTIVMIIGYFISMSTDGYLEVSYFREGELGITNVFSCIFFTTLISGTIFLILLLCIGEWVSNLIDLPVISLYFALVISFFMVYSNLHLNLYRIKGKIRQYGVVSCSNALLNLILSILLVKFFQQGWMGRMNAQLFCFSLFGIIGLFVFINNKHLKIPDISFWKKMLIWGIPLIPHLATNFIRQGCDRYIIDIYHSIEDVGLFSFALNLATIISMVGMGFNQSNSVDIYKVLGDKDSNNVSKKNKLLGQRKFIGGVYLIFTVLMILGCYMFIPIVFPKYLNAIGYIPILSVYALFVCLYYLYTNYLFYYNKTKNIMYVTFGSALVHLCLSLFLTKYSLYWTCVVYCFTQFGVFVLIRYMAMRELENQLS